MSEQAPQEYHKEIEKVFETSGPDIGRVKDVEYAQDLAKTEDVVRDYNKNMVAEGYVTQESVDKSQDIKLDNTIKTDLAKKAVNAAGSSFLRNIAVSGAHGQELYGNPMDEVNALKDEAKQVAADFDALKKAAQDQKETSADK